MKVYTVLFIALSSALPSPASAQMAVVDASNLTQAIKQVDAWKKQFDQMAAQMKQLQAQQASMTGNRGLGTIYTDPRLQNTVSHDVSSTFDRIQQSGAGALTPAAAAIRNSSQIYNCDDRQGADRSTCQAFLSNNAQAQAYQQNAMLLLNQRMAQIQNLQSQINLTNDPKSVAELQARLAAESTQVSNDANRIMVLRAMSDSAERAAQQALKERELHNLSLRSDGTDTFVYRPYTQR